MEYLVKQIKVVETAGIPLPLAYVAIILPLTDGMLDTHALCAALSNPVSCHATSFYSVDN